MKLFIHEDDFSEIEILPASTTEWCAAQIAHIAAFAARHEAPDGTGWTDIYMRPPAPAALASLAIPFGQTVEAIACRLPRFTEVSTGIYCSPVQVPGALGFGRAPNAAIVLFADKTSSHVEAMNLIAQAGGAEAEALFDTLGHLPYAAALIVVDWLRGCCFAPTNAGQVTQYLRSL